MVKVRMTKKHKEKLNLLREQINSFIQKVNLLHNDALNNGKKALKYGSSSQVDFWVVQYKLTSDYSKHAYEMLGQLDIAEYSKEMHKTAREFFDCMNKMAKSLSKVFGFSSIRKIENVFEKGQAKLEEQNLQNQDLLEETTSQFHQMQLELSNSYNESIVIDENEKNKILDEFRKDNNLSYIKNLF